MTTLNITAADVNKLRQQTGAGMMDCKKALTEANGDFEAAIDFLRKKGQKVAANRSDRDAKEGYVIGKTTADGKLGAIVLLSCETDFVAKTDDFMNFANSILDLTLAQKPASVEDIKALTLNGLSVSDRLFDMIGKIGEKIEISRYEVIESPCVIVYNHPGNRLVSMVGFSSEAGAKVGKDVAMQIAAMAPIAVDKDDVDATTLAREIEIGKDQARQEGKPEEMLEKIALGKIGKFYKEYTLLNQSFIKEDSLTIRQLLEQTEKGLTVTSFKRVKLG
ncbi:MAG: translation elongation factor Ts [Bacteroidota bacterium]